MVLAGGASTRFGSDKTRAQWHGVTLLEGVLNVVTPLVDEVFVVGPWAPSGVSHGTEPVADLGPLAGLAHGLSSVDAELALVIAVDHPVLQPALCSLLIERLRSSGADAVVPIGPDGLEPLVAAYRTSLAARAARLLDDGERRVRAIFDGANVEFLTEDDWSTVDLNGWSFRDADRPTELVEIQADLDAATDPTVAEATE